MGRHPRRGRRRAGGERGAPHRRGSPRSGREGLPRGHRRGGEGGVSDAQGVSDGRRRTGVAPEADPACPSAGRIQGAERSGRNSRSGGAPPASRLPASSSIRASAAATGSRCSLRMAISSTSPESSGRSILPPVWRTRFDGIPPIPTIGETVVTLSLRELGDDTEFDLAQGAFATEERHALHQEGWSTSLDKLDALVSRSDRD